MEHSVCRGSHGYVESHGVEECLACRYRAWQDRVIPILIIRECVPYYLSRSVLEQLDTVYMSGEDGAIAGEGESESLCEGVHRVGSEHS